MLSQRQIDAKMGSPSSTVRLIAERLGLARRHQQGRRVYTTGDAIRIKMACLLVENSYSPMAACLLVNEMGPQLDRLARDKGASAYLLWRHKAGEPSTAECQIFHNVHDALAVMECFDDTFVVPIGRLAKDAMVALLEEHVDG